MHKILTFSFLVFFGLVQSQEQNYIVNESSLWSTLETHCFPNGNNYSTYHIKFAGDTIIDQYVYTKILRSDDEFQTEWSFYGFIRENEVGEVYLKPPDYYEGKIYDFGVETGDTIQARNVYLNSDTLHYVVTGIDSVLLGGFYNKRVTLYEYINEKEEIWTEGLGSLFGILNSCNGSYGGVCGNYEALCYIEAGFLLYQHPDYNTCHYEVSVGTSENIAEQYLRIFPNPANTFFNIQATGELKNELPFNIRITNMLGQLIYQIEMTEERQKIQLDQVSSGNLIISITNSVGDKILNKVLVR